MGCGDVQRVIYFYLDGALGDARRADFTQHITLCPECEKRTRIQKRLREFVQRRLGRVSAPERFRTRLSRSLRALIFGLF